MEKQIEENGYTVPGKVRMEIISVFLKGAGTTEKFFVKPEEPLAVITIPSHL